MQQVLKVVAAAAQQLKTAILRSLTLKPSIDSAGQMTPSLINQIRLPIDKCYCGIASHRLSQPYDEKHSIEKPHNKSKLYMPHGPCVQVVNAIQKNT